MASTQVYSVCGMCTVRCPIQVEVEDDEVRFIQGNPHSPLKGALCARGGAGVGLLKDADRIRQPLIRTGERGEGKWRQASWDEAFAYVAEKLQNVIAQYGPNAVLWSDRSGPFVDLHKAFMHGIGSVNYSNHDVSCARNVHHAAKSVTGSGRTDFVYDFRNARHVVLQTRNILEAINVAEVNNLLDALDDGCKLTVIDIRATITAGKADRYFQLRPGTDYAFNLAVINELITKKLYDAKYVKKYVDGFEVLKKFVANYTPEWAEEVTGIAARDLRAFVADLAKAQPAVIWHPGWMTARYGDSFYVSRTAYIINALLGSIGSKGGLPMGAKPSDCGRKGLTSLTSLYPKPQGQRADGVGWKYTHFDAGPGLLHLAFKAMETQDPYPVKAYIAHRHDPMQAMPDPEAQKKLFSHLDLMVAITFTWSSTAWNADVVLPMSAYLERESIVASKSGLKPQFFLRERAVQPMHDTLADWEILTGLAKAMGMDKLAFSSIDEIRAFQLEGTGVSMADFAAKGFVSLTDKPIYPDRDNLVFKTPSGKLEIVARKWEENGQPSLKPFEAPAAPPEGQFRITFGRCGLHTQGHTVNNPILHEQMPENVLWINTARAKALGVQNGERVEITGSNGYGGRMKAFVTDFIHPEAIFMVHGFGSDLPVETRARGKGVADHRLMTGGLDNWDRAGGGISLQEHFVTVRKI